MHVCGAGDACEDLKAQNKQKKNRYNHIHADNRSFHKWRYTNLQQPRQGKSKEQLILEAKAERYVTQILALDRVLQNWRQKTLDKREATAKKCGVDKLASLRREVFGSMLHP